MNDHLWQIRLRRWHAQLGFPGYVGMVLLAMAAAVSWAAWQNATFTQALVARVQADEANRAAYADNPEVTTGSSTIASTAWPGLNSRADQVAILGRLEAAAQSQQLSWSKVDYALHDIGDSSLSSLEIRGVLKGGYPALRHFLEQALGAQPGMALRSLILQRDAPETRDLEARISLVVFLRDGWLPASAGSPTPNAQGGRP